MKSPETICPGLIISAPASGAGKTMVTLGLLAALRAHGLTVQPFKNGPDYIDPAFHSAASGRPSVNLDTWAMSEERIAGLIGARTDADLIIAEGSMGLFDGVASAGETGNGSSADLAALTGWPVVLVLDVSGQAQSAAAIAHGFATLSSGVRLAGVILNRVASPRHEALIRTGMKDAGIRVLGALPRRATMTLPERHLGLVQAEEQPQLAALLDDLGIFITAHTNIDEIVTLAAGSVGARAPAMALPPPGNRVALARDAAFSFVYPHLLEGWRTAGAEIVPFSPLADEAPAPDADACWIPGGYPELHAGTLAAAHRFRDGLQRFAAHKPVHGECGGYMAMGVGLVDAQGIRHAMAGLLGLETSFAQRRIHLGYRLATLHAPIPGYDAGQQLRGHEFHYATITRQRDEMLAHTLDANGTRVSEAGSRRGRATGTFFHLIAPAT
ncbi:cobyrinate a,c-diamide synthase [Acetobacter oeni]|uniref:Cobyrinate a,c-diamide synthase n=1 Tax=Acetobacter oeni TaxID=304077 RepID=A0A511XKS0_9PROT|nr:cobyrinate a,c-diamide synthase [Acetobacter oeni]MBB3883769.1 cobyrinic acid a,c-diamide synthase [Acetobacter oeni]NHO19885.1 cobyrinate a,c-diamide synthase [Acetobacter oeni]GBR10342.1 cobyrinic acid a,c-diamide synthase [Acetobacter oeni LMG 21952]GEN63524.1 hydrogenobyrinate a,c-diamide synthase [Acetobacter oeni]